MRCLTALAVKSASKPGRYGDGQTLYLHIGHSGAKSWVQRVTINRKRHDIGLGGYPAVSLAMARRRAAENRTAIAEGRDPLVEKRRSRKPTFAQAAEETFNSLRPTWRNNKHTDAWMQTLKRHAFPILGEMNVDRIGREDVLRVLTPIWGTKPETARRVRQRIRATLRWCWAHGFVTENAAGESIDGALPRMPTVKAHLRALPYQDVPAALSTIESSSASQAAKLCFRYLVLTAVRSGEARGATWDEISLEAAEWRIPGRRMKAGAEHRIPLSAPAIEVLFRARALDDGSGLVFPSPRRVGAELSDMTLTMVLRSTGLAARATVHGFRSAFRTWASEQTDAAHAVMEMSLAHTVGSSVEQAYARSNLLDKRRRLMREWASFLTAKAVGVQTIGKS